ncbi:MAG: sigma-54-dependent Fis family transcriptional regulator [Betaproteobacteria bacterium]|nr:sigma-54-dependent Fis family transcriptional regulator [Betaproteobacteria bacterium]
MKASRLPRNERILVIDDDPGVGESVRLLIDSIGCQSEIAVRGADGLARAQSGEFDLLITDLRLPDRDGLSITRSIKEAGLDLPVILMTSFSSLDTAIEALRCGALDYIIKPFSNDDFLHAIERALDERRIRRENALLKRSLKKAFASNRIIGDSAGIRRVFELVAKVAGSDANVLIQGESGTGKELVAQAIHYASPRAEGPFVPINCGAIPSELLESELFGHTKGAYTGAVAASEGLIREAQGGTLFLDEISELAPALQVKLLRVIQEKQVRPLGSRHVYRTDVRFLAATNRELKQALEQGQFRADLFYRLNVINIHVPPLRERGNDVEILARHFIEMHCRRLGKRIPRMTEEMTGFLHAYPWPGNVRELENLIERAVILTDGEALSCQDVVDVAPVSDHRSPPDKFTEEALEQALSIEKYIEEFVRRYQHQYSESELAAILGIGRKALWVRRNRWGLRRSGTRPPRHPAADAEA